MNKIEIEDWHYNCGEPRCCDDWGTKLIINGTEITDRFDDIGVEILKQILIALNVEYEIDEEN